MNKYYASVIFGDDFKLYFRDVFSFGKHERLFIIRVHREQAKLPLCAKRHTLFKKRLRC